MREKDPKLYRIIKHYSDIGIWNGWGIERFNKCCRLLGETPAELAASCAIKPEALRHWLKKYGTIPSYAALLFHLREREFLATKYGV